ncbi:MAG: DUF1624 domain-containing protein [Actinobacteria bacterium]|nr:DUF1624 domain-containing protein [Actinomycetota bacterium]MBU1942500.1 DUF1624 domain-containing protein [Actinomycetota bacterium]MBU2688807.1 DUF1624 domain-containing protein [Actinomycetota bacterium]
MSTEEATEPRPAPGTERILSIDVLRGFALIGMVMVHFMIMFGNDAAVDTWPYFILNHVLGDWGAACFLMLMGMSQVISKKKITDNMLLFKRALLRGVYLFVVGLLMLALAWGPFQIWQWDILTLMGFATVVLFFCRFLPSWAIVALSGAALAVTPWVRGSIDFLSTWGGKFIQVPVISRYLPGILLDPAKEYEVIWTPGKILKGFLFEGYFPVLPWIIFPLLGFVIGRRIAAGKLRGDLPFLAGGGAVLAVVATVIALAGRSRPGHSIIKGFIAPFSFYPDSFSMILFQLGMATIVFCLLYYCYDVLRKKGKKLSPLQRVYQRTSFFSLTFYFLHYQLIGWTLAVVYLVSGHYLLGDLMGSYPAMLCGLAAVLFLEVLIYYWEKKRGKYSLEWFLGALTLRLTPE